MLLGYRVAGSVPEILEGARLHLLPDRVRLDVDHRARVPDSEVVTDRLELLAAAAGVKDMEVREVTAPAD
jgi:exopolyphosphatase/guanosine-5'-triphosphate,3'-diphosphate pyrophosphatase